MLILISGWSIFTSTIAGQTPCFTVLPTVLTAPSITGLRRRAPISVVVTTQLYTLKYALSPQRSSFSKGAIIGIAVGVGIVVLLGILAVIVAVRKRRNKNKERGLSEGAIIGDGSHTGENRFATLYHPDIHEMPSPSTTTGPQLSPMADAQEYWGHQAILERPVITPIIQRPATPQEMLASTHIYEHHPAFNSATREDKSQPMNQDTASAKESSIPRIVEPNQHTHSSDVT